MKMFELDKRQQQLEDIKLQQEEQGIEFLENDLGDVDGYSNFEKDNELLAQVLSKQDDMISAILRNQKRSLLPLYEPDVFDGSDVTLFMFFMKAFERIIALHYNDAEKYYLLDKYTAGLANKLVKSCNNGIPSQSYHKALSMLNKRYGNEYVISQAYIRKLYDWPCIKSEDPEAMEDLSLYLTTCLNLMSNMHCMKQLNNYRDIMNIVRKLPFDIRKDWRMQACKIIDEGEKVEFKHLEEFVALQARILNQPIFGNIKDENHFQKFKSRLDKKCKKALTNRKDLISNVRLCLCCKKDNHLLTECNFFMKKPYEKKIAFIKNYDLCFRCLSKGHRSRVCVKPLVCNFCNRHHPTSLHRDRSYAKGNKFTQKRKSGHILKILKEGSKNKMTSFSNKFFTDNSNEKKLCFLQDNGTVECPKSTYTTSRFGWTVRDAINCRRDRIKEKYFYTSKEEVILVKGRVNCFYDIIFTDCKLKENAISMQCIIHFRITLYAFGTVSSASTPYVDDSILALEEARQPIEVRAIDNSMAYEEIVSFDNSYQELLYFNLDDLSLSKTLEKTLSIKLIYFSFRIKILTIKLHDRKTTFIVMAQISFIRLWTMQNYKYAR